VAKLKRLGGINLSIYADILFMYRIAGLLIVPVSINKLLFAFTAEQMLLVLAETPLPFNRVYPERGRRMLHSI